ncbi:MAG: hypothetical protein Edafosvirus6_20 [Edafosvirus sp.]|uniref:Uncharacterized protein n=1 Tax=Edafosvirus sp. TaxID=2487765 RepID=A0A3G4ZVZ6_9VIRU|nr:MAG: hypothetical protein Edafosvirus6_20 [Edafosvirus sp.]
MPNDCCKFPPVHVRRSINNTRSLISSNLPPCIQCLPRCNSRHVMNSDPWKMCIHNCLDNCNE